MLQPDFESADYGPRRLSVELTNICNLHCSYCLRDEDALYHTPAKFFAPELLESIVGQARQAVGITHLNFTGGEPTLHPRFDEILTIAESNNLKVSFVTNGWNFEKIWPKLLAHRSAITHVAFSIDGATRELHDKWRGEGSFVRLVRAFSRCFAGELPFMLKVVIRRDTLPQLEQLALFAARMGAAALHFAHVTPTSADVDNTSALNLDERSQAEKEIAILSRIFKMKIGIDVGYHSAKPIGQTMHAIAEQFELSRTPFVSGIVGRGREVLGFLDIVQPENVAPDPDRSTSRCRIVVARTTKKLALLTYPPHIG